MKPLPLTEAEIEASEASLTLARSFRYLADYHMSRFEDIERGPKRPNNYGEMHVFRESAADELFRETLALPWCAARMPKPATTSSGDLSRACVSAKALFDELCKRPAKKPAKKRKRK